MQNFPKEMFYLVGPKFSWKFSRNLLKGGGIFAGVVFFSLIIGSIYQYFFYQSLFQEINEQQTQQTAQTQGLGQQIQELEQKHVTLEQQIDQKNFLLSMTKQPDLVKQQDGKIFRQQESEKLRQIADLKKERDRKTKQVALLQEEEKKADKKIEVLFEQIAKLTRDLQKQPSVSSSSIPSFQAKSFDLIIDQFRFTANNQALAVQFNLRNIGNTPRSGRIMVRALRDNEANQSIPFELEETVTFRIRRFRAFTRDFVQSRENPYTAIRMIAWDTKRNKVLEEHYPIQ